jgi:acetyl-CoA carboxylase carboxyltransferase component
MPAAADGVVCGAGEIDGRPAYAFAEALKQGSHLAGAGPLTDARVFNFDELIDPRETRPRIVRAQRRARARTCQTVGPWTHTGIFP